MGLIDIFEKGIAYWMDCTVEFFADDIVKDNGAEAAFLLQFRVVGEVDNADL